MLYKTLSAAVYGIDASIIEVEVDVSGIKTMEDHFHTVGLPDAAVRESRVGYSQRGFRIRLAYGPRNPGRVWRSEIRRRCRIAFSLGELPLDGGVRGVNPSAKNFAEDLASGRPGVG
jgi:hypothetical protein